MVNGIVAGLVMVGVLVVIHEAGHFLVAKAFGIGAPVFSIGMGPRLFGFVWRGTDYRVSAFPVGGYVLLAGADPFGEEDADSWIDPEEDFMKRPVWQRLLVMFAGPAANLALPFVLFTAVLMLGEPQMINVIGTILPGTEAERVGLQEGDRILNAAGIEIEVWADYVRVLDDHVDKAVPLEVERDGQLMHFTLPAGAVKLTVDGLVDTEAIGMWASRVSSRIGIDDPSSPAARAGLRTGDIIERVDGVELKTWNEVTAALAVERPHELDILRLDEDNQRAEVSLTLTPDPSWKPRPDEPFPDRWGLLPINLFVGTILEGRSAEEAGVLPGDRMLRIDGEDVLSWSGLREMVARTTEGLPEDSDGPLRPVQVEVARAGVIHSLTIRPTIKRTVVRGEVEYRPLMGVKVFKGGYAEPPEVVKYYGVTEAVPRATEEGMLLFGHTMATLSNLFTGELKPSETVGGPVEIFRAAGEGAEEGIFSYARLMGTISIGLGVLNLLPVPVLDGGQIFFYLIEIVRGRPLPLELRERVQMVGVLALVAVMLMVTVMDVSRWLGGG